MNFQRCLRLITLQMAILLLLITSGALSPVLASGTQAESAAERFVLNQLQQGKEADLKEFSERISGGSLVQSGVADIEVSRLQRPKLNASFIAKLLTAGDAGLKIHSQKLYISNAVITGDLDLSNQEIPYFVYLYECTFNDNVILRGSRFARGLRFLAATFSGVVDFTEASIDDFSAEHCRFGSLASTNLSDLRIRRNFIVSNSTFESWETSFEGTRVGGYFVADKSRFLSKRVSFDHMRVDGDFSARSCVFSFDTHELDALRLIIAFVDVSLEGGESKVTFIGAHFADFFLNGAIFERIATVDFTRMEAEFIFLDDALFGPPSRINLERMSFKLMSPVNLNKLTVVLSEFNPEFYADLETSFRTHGYPDEADKIFIAKKRAERRANCQSFWRQCNRSGWALSLFEDALAGYGKSLQNLLYWSLGFLFIGVLVFRSEQGMRTKDRKDGPHYAGRYHAFWYSLDLFLPIIKLGEAETWTPKDNRRWAILYKKVHIIIGSLFVPIGLAAWTGIIK